MLTDFGRFDDGIKLAVFIGIFADRITGNQGTYRIGTVQVHPLAKRKMFPNSLHNVLLVVDSFIIRDYIELILCVFKYDFINRCKNSASGFFNFLVDVYA